MQPKGQAQSKGLTLIELMIAIAIAAILLTLVAPGFQNLFLSNRITAATNELVTALTLARTEAVRSGENATVCAVGNNWQQGWFVTRANTCQLAIDNDDIIRAWEAVPASIAVNSAVNFVVFDGLGARDGADAVTLTLQIGGNIADRRIQVSRGGSTSVAKVED